jgi:spore coat polysaccharide biosynthesis protein SpsF (cytidylyltransferase family)
LVDREHVTPYIWRSESGFKTAYMACPFDLHWMQYSVDTEQDLHIVSALLPMLLGRYGHGFTWRDIWSCVLASPWIEQQMRQRQRNSGYLAQVGATQEWNEVRYGVS